ncbi:hypothetical protein EK904_011037 [Melospiza melodia maxima]|nr:hypothetical protein EK904_011037 [Melospiza melodia maxima]
MDGGKNSKIQPGSAELYKALCTSVAHRAGNYSCSLGSLFSLSKYTDLHHLSLSFEGWDVTLVKYLIPIEFSISDISNVLPADLFE